MKQSKKVSTKRKVDLDDPVDRDFSELLRTGKWQRVKFEMRPKNKTITIRVSEELLEAVKKQADKEGMDYQKFIRIALEQIVLKAG